MNSVLWAASCLAALAAWFRVTGDGPDFHTWEREYLIPPVGDKEIMLLSGKQRALTGEELAAALGTVQ